MRTPIEKITFKLIDTSHKKKRNQLVKCKEPRSERIQECPVKNYFRGAYVSIGLILMTVVSALLYFELKEE